ncbi:MAG: hypothetical protein J0L69_05605 [Bacteroidetes bacterium]|nr:hypothetical protein [Bacteroidota bacterium]
MATITKSYSESISESKTQGAYDAFLKKLNFSYFGLISMTITIGSILGGLTAMQIFENDAPIWQLAVCMSAAMANNVAAIGQAPIKWLFNTFCITTVLNALLLLVNL